MIVIKTRQPDPELEQKIRMLLEREHIEAEQISIDSWEKLVLPGLTLDGMTHEVSCNGRKISLTRLEFDLLLMDESNLCDILRLVGGDPQHKVSLLMAHTGQPREVADPWFTGDFEATWQDVLEGCTALLEELR